ncbi:MAG: DUF1264 domain-containing protein [Isosphaeraceae bacterium]|nr:DUF1264 domain-containing protein [Isosphaeraceae bacterium]
MRVVYDGTGPDARLIGVEYLVGGEVFRKTPAEEQATPSQRNTTAAGSNQRALHPARYNKQCSRLPRDSPRPSRSRPRRSSRPPDNR